jgi:hypothetical protein
LENISSRENCNLHTTFPYTHSVTFPHAYAYTHSVTFPHTYTHSVTFPHAYAYTPWSWHLSFMGVCRQLY